MAIKLENHEIESCMGFRDLREFLKLLESEGELLTVNEEIDPHLEIGAVGYLTRMGKVVLFTNVKGSDERPIMGEPVKPPALSEEIKKRLGL